MPDPSACDTDPSAFGWSITDRRSAGRFKDCFTRGSMKARAGWEEMWDIGYYAIKNGPFSSRGPFLQTTSQCETTVETTCMPHFGRGADEMIQLVLISLVGSLGYCFSQCYDRPVR